MVILAISCRKHDDLPENPEWLRDKIAMMDTADYYIGTAIYLYEWHGEFFYWIEIPLSSCMMCEFYSYQGDKYVWTNDSINDFQKNAVKRKVVWQRNRI